MSQDNAGVGFYSASASLAPHNLVAEKIFVKEIHGIPLNPVSVKSETTFEQNVTVQNSVSVGEDLSVQNNMTVGEDLTVAERVTALNLTVDNSAYAANLLCGSFATTNDSSFQGFVTMLNGLLVYNDTNVANLGASGTLTVGGSTISPRYFANLSTLASPGFSFSQQPGIGLHRPSANVLQLVNRTNIVAAHFGYDAPENVNVNALAGYTRIGSSTPQAVNVFEVTQSVAGIAKLAHFINTSVAPGSGLKLLLQTSHANDFNSIGFDNLTNGAHIGLVSDGRLTLGYGQDSTTNTSLSISQTGLVRIPTSTASTSPTTGALAVTGGVGVGGALHVAGKVENSATTEATSTTAAALTCAGGVGVVKNLRVGGEVYCGVAGPLWNYSMGSFNFTAGNVVGNGTLVVSGTPTVECNLHRHGRQVTLQVGAFTFGVSTPGKVLHIKLSICLSATPMDVTWMPTAVYASSNSYVLQPAYIIRNGGSIEVAAAVYLSPMTDIYSNMRLAIEASSDWSGAVNWFLGGSFSWTARV